MEKLNNQIHKEHKGGNTDEIKNKHSRRYTDEGILCYGCDKICSPEDYWKGVTRCKECCNKRLKKVQKRKTRPLW